MKRPHHIKVAEMIAADSFALLHYEALPRNASVVRQCEALRADKRWLESHHTEIVHRLDRLCADIGAGIEL